MASQNLVDNSLVESHLTGFSGSMAKQSNYAKTLSPEDLKTLVTKYKDHDFCFNVPYNIDNPTEYGCVTIVCNEMTYQYLEVGPKVSKVFVLCPDIEILPYIKCVGGSEKLTLFYSGENIIECHPSFGYNSHGSGLRTLDFRNLPKLEVIGENFLSQNTEFSTLIFADSGNLKRIGHSFCSNASLVSVRFPKKCSAKKLVDAFTDSAIPQINMKSFSELETLINMFGNSKSPKRITNISENLIEFESHCNIKNLRLKHCKSLVRKFVAYPM